MLTHTMHSPAPAAPPHGAAARGSRRLKIFQPAALACASGGEAVRIHLLDLSRTGALAHAAAPPLETARVTILCGAMEVGATVVWTRGRRFGLRFSAPVCETLVEALAAG